MGVITKKIKGTEDVLPKDSYRWQFVEDVMRKESAAYGFKEIRTPASVSGTGTFGCTSSFSRQRELTRFPTEISVRITSQLIGLRTSLQPNLDACTGLTITLLELSFCVTASFHR